jgi:hypothetical protein
VVRTLHIIACASQSPASEGSDLVIACCAEHVRRQPDARVLLLATRHDAIRARSLGLEPDAILAPPLGRPELTLPGARRFFRELGPAVQTIAWGPRSARLATLGGLDTEQIALADLSPPAITPSSAADRAAIRRSLGIDNDTLVFLGVGDPASRFDAFFMLRMVSLFDVAGRKAIGLFPRHAASFDRARRFHREVGLSMGVMVREESWIADASWADFALIAPLLTHQRRAHERAATTIHQLAARALTGAGVCTLVSQAHAWRLGLSDAPNLIIARSPGHAAVARRALTLVDRAEPTLRLTPPPVREAAS